jgi:hypothetical protein
MVPLLCMLSMLPLFLPHSLLLFLFSSYVLAFF